MNNSRSASNVRNTVKVSSTVQRVVVYKKKKRSESSSRVTPAANDSIKSNAASPLFSSSNSISHKFNKKRSKALLHCCVTSLCERFWVFTSKLLPFKGPLCLFVLKEWAEHSATYPSSFFSCNKQRDIKLCMWAEYKLYERHLIPPDVTPGC